MERKKRSTIILLCCLTGLFNGNGLWVSPFLPFHCVRTGYSHRHKTPSTQLLLTSIITNKQTNLR